MACIGLLVSVREIGGEPKSHRYGQALEDSLTRQGGRLQILLLVSTLASFVSWLAGMPAK